MKLIKSAWLEISFCLLISIVIILSANNSIHGVSLKNEKILPQSDIQLRTVGFVDYIKEIKKLDNFMMIIVVKDIQGFYTTQEMIDELKSLGFDQADILMEQSYHSFIGVYSNGDVVCQKVGGDENITFGQYVNDHYIYARSATWSLGNVGDIYIDDVKYSVNNRGFNIVTIDNINDELIDSVAYDVYVEDIPLYRLVNGEVVCIRSTVEER